MEISCNWMKCLELELKKEAKQMWDELAKLKFPKGRFFMDKKSALWGASKERTAILAKVRRMRKANLGHDWQLALLETWLLLRDERYQKRKGGLGK